MLFRLRWVAFLTFLVLCGGGGNAAAVVWQDHPFGESAPQELTRVPVVFTENSGTARKSAFALSFPLPQGALFDTRQLRLCQADGKEIPLQSALLESWPDGSCKFLFLRGVISLAAREKKQCFVEFGSRVLRSAVPGIVTAAAKERMLVDTGTISAELDTRKFQLPQKITAGETICGRFHLPKMPDDADFSIEEDGRCSTLLAFRNQKTNAVLRMRFFRKLPLIALEYLPGGKETYSLQYLPFSPSKKTVRVTLPEPGKLLWIDLIRGEVMPLESEFPVVGIVSADYLSAAGLFPEAYRPANDSMRKFADQWVARSRAKRDSLPLKTLAALWFRTGEKEDFLPLFARLSSDRTPEAAEIRKKIWLMTGINSCSPEENPDPALTKTPSAASPGTTAAVVEKAKMLLPGNSPEWNRLISLLAYGFDPNTGSWKEFLDERGASSGGEAGEKLNLLCARLLIFAANRCDDQAEGKNLAAISFAAVKRIFFDRAALDDFADMGEWFQQAETYLKKHPDERFEFNDQKYWDNQCRANPPSFSVKVGGKRFFSVVLQRSPAQLTLTRTPISQSAETHSCTVTDSAGKTVFSLTTERPSLDRKILLTGKPGEMFTVALLDDASGLWNAGSDENALVMLPVGGNGVTFCPGQWKRFFFDVPPASPTLRLRFQPLSPRSSLRLLLVDPRGEEIEITEFFPSPLRPADAPRKEILSPEAGRWEIRLHVSSGDLFIASDTVSPFLTFSVR